MALCRGFVAYGDSVTKPAHYRGTYHVQAKRLRDAANADPNTRCWRCRRTLAEHPNTKTGKPPSWQAGHVEDADGNHTGELAPEADVCNVTEGARKRQRLPRRFSEPI